MTSDPPNLNTERVRAIFYESMPVMVSPESEYWLHNRENISNSMLEHYCSLTISSHFY